MEDILIFNPGSEFEIIESIEFEEEIQRPEELRFFTLEEQLLDYFEKVLPKKKNITKFEYETIAKEIDRVRELYGKSILLTDTDYVLETGRKKISVPWVHSIYSKFDYTAYSFAESWVPFYERGRRSQPNFYQQMLTALPKPYKTIENTGVPLTEDSITTNEQGKDEIRALTTYNRTKSIIHEDSTMSVINQPIANTADDIKSKGFFLEARKDEIPNPFNGHPFLSSNGSSSILTNESLLDVFPTVEAILTHGVPTTVYPYTEGAKFLKIYDVKLSQVPWVLWKVKFPPSDTITTTPDIEFVRFPDQEDEVAPSKSLQDTYLVPWDIGINPRFWMMRQEDAGTLVVKMLLSKAADSGKVPPETMGEKPVAQFPTSSPEECLITDSFDSFINSGIYRNGFCIPTAYIAQERHQLLSLGKQPWLETTEFDILKNYQKILKRFQFKPVAPRQPVYENYQGQIESELHKDVNAILSDPHRTSSDKAESISLITRNIAPTNKIFYDSNGVQIICSHTVSLLNGDLVADRLKFYAEWSTIDDGFRVCKHCGEEINSDVFVSQDEFDDQGHLVVSHDYLPTNVFHGESHPQTFISSLTELRRSFMLDNAGEVTFYTLLSLLQVLPAEGQLLPILQNIREISMVLKANKKIAKPDKERIEGILGVAGMVILLQSHNPFLTPRRSFGSKILKMSGYPRDSDDATNCPTLDMILSVIKTTFQASPNTFKGPSTTLFRKILTSTKEVRKETLVYLKQAANKFKTQLLSAKERYTDPPTTESFNQIFMPLIFIDKTEYSAFERLGEEAVSQCTTNTPKCVLTGKLLPNIVQESETLWNNIKPSSYASEVVVKSTVLKTTNISTADIRKRIGLGFPKGLKLDKIETFIKSDTDAVGLMTLLNRILDVLSKNKFPNDLIAEYRAMSVSLKIDDKSLFRDAARGILFEVFHEIAKQPNKTSLLQAISNASQRDLTMRMILITKEEATKEDSVLRATEREVFKKRMRTMNDTERQITKMLLDIGIAPYIITNEDREFFSREYQYPDPSAEYTADELALDIDRPEEGYNAERDYVDNGDLPVGDTGQELQVDYGDYGDRAVRDYEDYANTGNMDDGNGYGV
jgi:hypothetical protein